MMAPQDRENEMIAYLKVKVKIGIKKIFGRDIRNKGS